MKRVLSINYHQDASIGREKRLKTPVSDQNLRANCRQQKTNAEYTVGWICAVNTEYVAAQAILDEKHAGPEKVSQANQSDFTLGRIGKHNVVIATLPYGEYGTASAATVAADMSHNFPNIRIRLMAGIGGGAPSERNDIRLGDVVVSAPSNGKSGVFQYDYGKTIQGEPFQPTRFLDQPPMILRTAMSGLMAQYECEGHLLEETINAILERNPRLLGKYSRPHESSDRLYCNTFAHPSNADSDCAKSCGDNSLIVRPRRTQENSSLVIHYGVIASANQLMKNAIIRDKISSEYDILCFEMEAGGLMNNFPCLVIRGICDYSDSHTNKIWQGYAAMAAASYAKDLINRLPPLESATPRSTKNSSSNQLHIQEKMSHTISVEQMNALLDSLRFDQIEARQMTIKNAHAKTCRWLLRKSEYINWLNIAKISEHRGFLWIKGKPGTGKSTLMKFALNSAKKTMRDKIIIYFFFNARGGDMEKSTIGMYRSLLLQLLEKLPELRNTLELPHLTTRSGEEYRWTTEILTNLLDQAIQNLKESSIVCFIDALDECDESQVRNMIKFFELVGESATTGRFRVCFSSRHYPHISISKGLSLILEGQEGHSQDMLSYINSELKIGNSTLANQIRSKLQEKASGVFMWVVLVVNILNKEHDKGRIHVLKKRLQEIPADLHALFRDILTRDRQDGNELLLCIQWVLFTKNPLRPEQLYFAMLSDVLYERNPDEITASDMERFILNSSKGLTEVTRSKNPTVQFIHESVKDYLLKENGLRDIWPDFQTNVNGDSHERLKQCCLNYIAIGKTAFLELALKASPEEAKSQRQLANASFPFLEYAVTNVLHHANEAEAGGANQAGFLKEFPLDDWIQLDNFLERYETRQHKRNVSFLYILAELNMGHLIRRHPDRLSFLKVEQERYGAPIFAALAMKSSASIRAFLDSYLEIEPSFHDIIDNYYYDGVVENNLGRSFKFVQTHCFGDFVTKGAALAAAFCLKMNDMSVVLNSYSRYELLIAVEKGHKSILKLFLDEGAQVDHQVLLEAAISNKHELIVNLLLANGAKFDDTTQNGRTFFSIAAGKGLYSLVEQSLNSGVEFDTKYEGRTPLSYAAQSGSEATVKLLLDRGSEINTQDDDGRTPLSYAAESGYESTVQLLLERGAEIDIQDNNQKTPLSYGAHQNNEAVLEVLLLGGANIEAKDNLGMTPLSLAATKDSRAVVELLLDRGAEINVRDSVGRTPLSRSVSFLRREHITELLLDRGAPIAA
ncbi:Pfs, NB-ARC and ankyrin domain protein [Trichoderma sp. SZMC 28012]